MEIFCLRCAAVVVAAVIVADVVVAAVVVAAVVVADVVVAAVDVVAAAVDVVVGCGVASGKLVLVQLTESTLALHASGCLVVLLGILSIAVEGKLPL